MKRIQFLLVLIALAASVFVAGAAVITVTTTDNVNPAPGAKSLVQAITELQDGNTIAFNIPGDGPHVIQTPLGGYPIITENNVTIDGYTQPGSSPNTNPILGGNNAKIQIVLDSSDDASAPSLNPTNPALLQRRSTRLPFSGYGDSENGILAVERGDNFRVRGLSFLSRQTPGSDEDPSIYCIALVQEATNARVQGCWFGLAPDGTTVKGSSAAVAAFRYRTGGDVYSGGMVVGTDGDGVDDVGEFNIMMSMHIALALELPNLKISGNYFNVFPDGKTFLDIDAARAELEATGRGGSDASVESIENGRFTENTVIGTDGDGKSDANERNIIAHSSYSHDIELYSNSTNLVVAGNYFGVGVDGVTEQPVLGTAVPNFVNPGGSGSVRIGSNGDGVSDHWEGNLIYNVPGTRFVEAGGGVLITARGNKMVNNGFAAFPFLDGANGLYENYYANALVNAVAGAVPVLIGATNDILEGTLPAPNTANYAHHVVDIYVVDPFAEALGMILPGAYAGSFVEGSAVDQDPAPNAFKVNLAGIAVPPGAVAVPGNSNIVVAVTYSTSAAGTQAGASVTGPASNPVMVPPFVPGGIDSVGLTRIVPDTPVINPEIPLLNNWEPYISVLGNSTFLIEANTFTDPMTDPPSQRYVVMFQPAAGGAGQLGEAFFADDGTPYKAQINLSRQNGNPGRVAGDKRPGAVNFITGAEVSPHGFAEFQSDLRWTMNGIYADVNRYCGVQTFRLDPATLAQRPLSKLFDAVNGQNTADFAGNPGEVSRFGGELAALDNGNFVVVIDDRSNMIVPARATTAAIITPRGQVVKSGFAVRQMDIWSNVAAYKGGFCVRVHQFLHFFDNDGNEKFVVDQSTSGEGFDAGRGDGTRIGSHVNSPYVFLAGKVPPANNVPGIVRVAVWDSRDGTFVAKADVSEGIFSGLFDRVNLAVDALNRVTVSWVSRPTGYEADQVAARVLAFNESGKSFSTLTRSFFPFINSAQSGGIRSLQMSVAMTTKQICIAAKGEINLQNKPELGADSPTQINFYTVLGHPDPKDDPTPPAPPTTPGKPEDNGLPPKTATVYINLPPVQTPPESINNGRTESLGVAIAANGNVIVGWEDDGDALTDLEAVWTLFNPSGASITPDTLITSVNPEFAGQTVTSKFLSYFRTDGSAVSGRTSWGPKIKANLFGDGIGMGGTSFELGLEVAELFDINMDAGGGGDFPAVQLLNNSGQPLGIVSGLSDADAEPDGNVRIGDWEYLSNGNIVIVGESRQKDDAMTKYGGTAPAEHAIYRIVDPTGQEVKATSLVSESPEGNANIWHGVGVTANGFAVRFNQGGAKVRLFDNNGNPVTGNIDLATLTGQPATAGGGRGDGAGFHGNGKDAYVVVNSSGAQGVFVTVLNANGTLRWSRNATEGFDLRAADRVDAAIDPAGRVLVVFDDANETGGAFRLVQGRLFDAAGNPLGGTFYISEKETAATATMESRQARAAWRGDTVAVVWQSKNAVAGDAPPRVVALRLFTIPAVVAPELVITSITAAGNNVTIEWSGGTGPFLLQRKSSLSDAAWVDFATTPNRSITVPRQGLAGFFRVSDQAPTAVTLLTVSLSGAAERPNPVTTSGTGLGTLSLKGNTLTYNISYANLSGAASAAHIHGPATTEQSAGVMVPLSGAAGTAGVLSGSLTLSDSQKAEVLAGRTYVNIHTANFGGGEIRGQIIP